MNTCVQKGIECAPTFDSGLELYNKATTITTKKKMKNKGGSRIVKFKGQRTKGFSPEMKKKLGKGRQKTFNFPLHVHFQVGIRVRIVQKKSGGNEL